MAVSSEYSFGETKDAPLVPGGHAVENSGILPAENKHVVGQGQDLTRCSGVDASGAHQRKSRVGGAGVCSVRRRRGSRIGCESLHPAVIGIEMEIEPLWTWIYLPAPEAGCIIEITDHGIDLPGADHAVLARGRRHWRVHLPIACQQINDCQ